MPAIQIRNWSKHFENAASKKLKRLDWLALPIKMDGDGYAFLVDHPEGAAHFGAWIAILQIAAKQPQEKRGYIPEGVGGICQSLSRVSRIPAKVFESVIPRLLLLEWIEQVPSYQQPTSTLGDSPNTSADSASTLADSPNVVADSPNALGDVGRKVAAQDRTGQDITGKENHLCPSDDGRVSDSLFPGELQITKLVRMPRKAAELSPDQESWFAMFWSAYWRHDGKQAARKAYGKAAQTLEVANLIMAAMLNQRDVMLRRDEDKRPMASTWLNQERWEDEAARARASPSQGKDFVSDVESVFRSRLERGDSPW